MRFSRAIGLLALLATPAVAQPYVSQSGTVTPGHVPAWVTSGVQRDGGSATNGYVTNLGIFQNGGLPECITASTIARSAFNPASSPYSQFCMFATQGGSSGLTLNSYNGAADSAFSLEVNGVTETFPFSGGGGTNIPTNTVLGNVSGITQPASALTKTQLTTLINPFSSSLPGAVPASGGSASQFLNGAGSFASLSYSNLPAIASKAVLGNGTSGSAVPSAAFSVPNTTDTLLASVHGSAVTSDCVAFNASDGSLKDAGGPCTTGGGGGTVSSGTTNQIGYYASDGTTISGLSTANSSVLVTSSGGAPSLSTTLPSALTYPTPTITGVITDATFRANLTTSTVVSGGSVVPANTPLFMTGTASGTSTVFSVPQAYFNQTETVTNTTGGTSIDGLFVNHGFQTGEGIRTAIHGQLYNQGSTTGAASDGDAFYVALLGSTFVAFNDGGISGTPKGDFYGGNGITEAVSGATFLHGVVGWENDVSVQTGASTAEKIIEQLVGVNSDAVKGTVTDAMEVLTSDGTTTAQFDFGIAFGKTGTKWPVSGTLIGTYATTNSVAATNGVDFSGVTFSGNAFKSNGFNVNPGGLVNANFLQTQNTTNFVQSAAPGTVTAGNYAIYMDSADGKLKAKAGTTVTVLAPSPGGSGTVSSSTANNIAYYATTGTAVSGLASAANAVLGTNGSGVPSISTTLPSGLTIPAPTVTGTLTSTSFISGVFAQMQSYSINANTPPGNPGSGQYVMYMDSSGGQVKFKDSSGDVTIIPAVAGTLMVGANNLSDITSASTARSNLSLGGSATCVASTASLGALSSSGWYVDGCTGYSHQWGNITIAAAGGTGTFTFPHGAFANNAIQATATIVGNGVGSTTPEGLVVGNFTSTTVDIGLLGTATNVTLYIDVVGH